MSLATLQQLRSFVGDEHPLNLEPGQIAFNLSTANFDPTQGDYNIYMYIGNSSNDRFDEGGTRLVTGGDTGKGWVRYRLRNLSPEGDTVYGDFTISGAKVSFTTNGSANSELVVPSDSVAPASGTATGSVRYNTTLSRVEAWNGGSWSTASRVAVSATAPTLPLNGDLWMDTALASPKLKVYVVPTSGPAEWRDAIEGSIATALQPGNGVSSNVDNQIETIDTGSY